MEFANLLTARPGSYSGQSSASSRRHAAAYRHWSSASLAPASASGHFLVCHKWAINSAAATAQCRKWFKKCRNISGGKRRLGSCLSTPVCSRWTYPKEGCVVCILCVPAVVFTNSPQQNLPIGCPGLAKLPNSISFLWESDGLASWYSEETEGGRDKDWDDRKTRWDHWCEEALRRAQWGARSKNFWLFWVPGLTAVDCLHLPVDGIADHQGADEELSPPERKMRQIVCSGTKKQPKRWGKCETQALMYTTNSSRMVCE